MTSFDRSILGLAFVLAVPLLACGGADPGDPTAGDGQDPAVAASDVKSRPSKRRAKAKTAPSVPGTVATGSTVTAGSPPPQICGGPPLAALCQGCPNQNAGYLQVDGEPTCECCSP